MSKVDITVLVPAKNEEKNLGSCLTPLSGWAKKIIVVDSNSTDRTTEIAASFDAEVIQFNYKGGWPKKRQHVLDTYQFTTEWVMLLDCDEILTEESRQEIEKAIRDTSYDGYRLYFRMEFLGGILKYSYPGLRKLSLFRAGKGNYEMRYEDQDASMGDMEVHEHVIVDGKVGNLSKPIIHRNVNNLSRFIVKHDEYSNYEGKVHTTNYETEIKAKFWGTKEERRRYLKKKLIRNPLSPIFYFMYLYFLKGGFLDGRPGFYYILYQAIYLYFVNSKIYEIEVASQSS